MVCPELDGQPNCNTSRICTIGLYAHEFGHIIGLPDLYDRDESNGDSEGLGNWCLMAAANFLVIVVIHLAICLPGARFKWAG